ncbi:MAG: hypothetical protein V7L23_18635 [Nostoc sp.]|uniref:hypothetical protein n=1 Tax=Nostoc sp. TaxID=1180 RepID=UPI002FF1B785
MTLTAEREITQTTTDTWYWDTTNNTLATAEQYQTQQQQQQQLPIKPLTQKQRTIQLFCSLYGYDTNENYTVKRIKNIVLNNLSHDAFMVAVSLECTGKDLWVALEAAMWWHRDNKARK